MGKDRVTPDEALRLSQLIEQLGRVDLDQIKLDSMMPFEQMAEKIGNDQKFKRKLAGAGKPKKPHWRTVRARKKKARAKYYHTRGKAATQRKKANLLRTPEGWWTYQTSVWQRKKVPYTITREEFLEVLWPALGGEIPVFMRYDSTRPYSLENALVYKNNTKQVIFDGMEWSLKQQGYIL